MKTRVHIFVSGKVQGVFFRSKTAEKASHLEVTGWVKNLWDGRVEAVFEGKKEAVEEMIDFCRIGPSRSLVKDIEIQQEIYIGEYRDFSITY